VVADELASRVALAIEPYRHLLEQFVDGQITADEFETEYLKTYLSDESPHVERAVFAVVDGFFADVDAYVADAEIRDHSEGDLGPEDLRERACELLRRAGALPS
jgi:hypothetical protein